MAWAPKTPTGGLVLGFVCAMVLLKLLALSHLLVNEFAPPYPQFSFDTAVARRAAAAAQEASRPAAARQAQGQADVAPRKTSMVLPTRHDSATVAANWARATACKSVDTAAMYNWDGIGGEHSVERTCHFVTSPMFGPPDATQIAPDTPTLLNVTLVLLDLYTQYGILSSKRGGSMLGIYRAGGHLRGDSADGDHFLFLPQSEIVPLECFGEALQAAAQARGCGATHMPLKRRVPGHNAISSNIYCGGVAPNRGLEFSFDSHGTLYEAEYLLGNVDKNERLAKHGVYIHDAMRSLCFAPFNGLPALVFDSPHIQAQLSANYGTSYLTPKPGQKSWKYVNLIRKLLNHGAEFGDVANFDDSPLQVKTDPVYLYRSN